MNENFNKRKAIIYGFINFPRMSAGANYTQYLALTLDALGYDVTVVSSGNVSKCEYNDDDGFFYYKGIRFDRIVLRKNKILAFLDFHFCLTKYFIQSFKKLNLSEGDIAIGYIPSARVIKKTDKYLKRKKVTTAHCIVEHFDDNYFADKYFWVRNNYYKAFEKYIAEADFVLPISKYLENIFNKKGCRTFTIPCMFDVSEYPYNRKKQDDYIHFVFPTNGKKDDLEGVLRALDLLDEKNLNRVKIHLTGVAAKTVKNSYGDMLNKHISEHIVLHDWMEYDDLVSLYLSMDFLLLPRKTTQMTKANFPSKIPEVMNYGVIPITSKVGDCTADYLMDGVDSIIIDGHGSNITADGIKRAMELTKEQRKNMAKHARECVEDKFDYRVWVERLGDFLNYYYREK